MSASELVVEEDWDTGAFRGRLLLLDATEAEVEAAFLLDMRPEVKKGEYGEENMVVVSRLVVRRSTTGFVVGRVGKCFWSVRLRLYIRKLMTAGRQ